VSLQIVRYRDHVEAARDLLRQYWEATEQGTRPATLYAAQLFYRAQVALEEGQRENEFDSPRRKP
jgi:hypothetical protein